MTPTLRKAAILSVVILSLAALLAVLFLDGPDLDPDMGPGEPGQGGEPAHGAGLGGCAECGEGAERPGLLGGWHTRSD